MDPQPFAIHRTHRTNDLATRDKASSPLRSWADAASIAFKRGGRPSSTAGSVTPTRVDREEVEGEAIQEGACDPKASGDQALGATLHGRGPLRVASSQADPVSQFEVFPVRICFGSDFLLAIDPASSSRLTCH
jgi:hypothetical protein